MFENYSLADLFANVYKKLKINIIVFTVLYLLIAIPLIHQSVNSVGGVKTVTLNYSSYVIYKVSSEEKIARNGEVKLTGYSDFYQKIISSNLNGAYLFSDINEEKLSEYAKELGTDVTALKSSNKDFWIKKVIVSLLGDDNGIAVEILTPSKELNSLLEGKFDKLVNEYKTVYEGVNVEKLNTVYSGLEEVKEEISGYNVKRLVLILALIFVLLAIVVVGGNSLLYMFNPTINRAGDYSKYKEINKVFDVETLEDINFIKKQFSSDITLVTTIKNITTKVTGVKYIRNLADLDKIDKVVFVEEYGVTRYKNFEKQLQQLNSFDKEILGVISFKL